MPLQLDVEEAAIVGAVADAADVMRALQAAGHLALELWDFVGSANVTLRQTGEFVLGIAVARDRSGVHGQELERLAVVHPDRLGIGLEQLAELHFALLHLPPPPPPLAPAPPLTPDQLHDV